MDMEIIRVLLEWDKPSICPACEHEDGCVYADVQPVTECSLWKRREVI